MVSDIKKRRSSKGPSSFYKYSIATKRILGQTVHMMWPLLSTILCIWVKWRRVGVGCGGVEPASLRCLCWWWAVFRIRSNTACFSLSAAAEGTCGSTPLRQEQPLTAAPIVQADALTRSACAAPTRANKDTKASPSSPRVAVSVRLYQMLRRPLPGRPTLSRDNRPRHLVRLCTGD